MRTQGEDSYPYTKERGLEQFSLIARARNNLAVTMEMLDLEPQPGREGIPTVSIAQAMVLITVTLGG